MINDVIGWAGSALLLISVAQKQKRRLHALNIVASAVLGLYNIFIGAIPGVALNIGLVLVNLWQLRSTSTSITPPTNDHMPQSENPLHGGRPDTTAHNSGAPNGALQS